MAELREEWPEVEVTLIQSGGGVFEVVVDDKVVFSKKELHRHAEPGEVVDMIKASA